MITLVLLLTAADFQSWVRQQARAHDLYVEAWWSANLDRDAAPERVARLCPLPDNEAQSGFFVIEDDARWLWLRFDIDGRTPWCREGELDANVAMRVVPDDFDPSTRGKREPRFRETRARTIRHWQGNHSTWETVEIALRGGRPAIVRREHLYRPHCSEEATDVVWDEREDWDALAAETVTRKYAYYKPGAIVERARLRLVPISHAGDEGSKGDGDVSWPIGSWTLAHRHGRPARLTHLEGGRWPRPDEALVALLYDEKP